jgi:hypothetical protein
MYIPRKEVCSVTAKIEISERIVNEYFLCGYEEEYLDFWNMIF